MRLVPVESSAARRLGAQELPDLREIPAVVDVEFPWLERVSPDRLDVIVGGELLQREQPFARWRQCKQRARFADQQQEPLPGNLLVEHVRDDAIDRDVGTHHGLEEIAAIHRRDCGDEPALPRRIHVGVRPDDGT